MQKTLPLLTLLALAACSGDNLVLPAEGAPAAIEVVQGDQQSGRVGTQLAEPVVVQVTDSRDRPVEGTEVAFTFNGGSGSDVLPKTAVTDADGRASARIVLGTEDGPAQGEARVVSEDNSPALAAEFTATGTIGPSASLVIQTQPPATATVGVAFSRSPVVQARDAAGNDVQTSGIAITAAVASGGGTLAGTTTRTTDGNGRATFNDLRITGAVGQHTLIFAASGHTSVTSTPIDVRKAATTTTISADGPDPSSPGQAVTVSFTVTSAGGTPAGNVTVTASGGAESCTASVATGNCALTLQGEGSRTLTATYAGDNLFEGSSDTESHQVTPANTAPSAANDGYTTTEGFERTLSVAAPGVLANDTDPEGNPLRAENASDPPHGTVTLNTDGSFAYNPDPDYYGEDSFTYRANDGTASSNTATVTITVLPVNDAPRFEIRGGDQIAPADGGPQRVENFAEITSPGAPNEEGQTFEFLVEVDAAGAALFSQAPAISPDGTLTYVPSGTTGSALITVRLRDNGGTDNGGQDTSDPQTFTITLIPAGGGA